MRQTILEDILALKGQNPAPQPYVKTMGTPTQFVPTAKTLTKASSAPKTVLQDIKKQEYSITPANNAQKADFQTRETNMNVNRGQTAIKAQ